MDEWKVTELSSDISYIRPIDMSNAILDPAELQWHLSKATASLAMIEPRQHVSLISQMK